MKIKSRVDGTVVEGILSTDHSASSYRQPVLVLPDGTGLFRGDLRLSYDVIEASPREKAWLEAW